MKSEPGALIKAIKEKGMSIEAEMSFFDHLDVLRGHLIRASIAIVIFAVAAFSYYSFIFDEIIMGPGRVDFWTYRMMCAAVAKFSLGPEFCVTRLNYEIINTELGGQFTLQLNSSLMIGIILGVPYLLFEIWRFVKPALHENERKSAAGFVFWASLLFIIGLLFGYYIVSPLSVNFLTNFEVSKIINNKITIDSYFSIIATLSIGSAITFELPTVVFILSKLGIMTPQFMRASRRYSTVIILIIAAIVTPTPDLIIMLTVSLPLFLLYEVSIYISAMVMGGKEKAEKEFYAG
ncbi:MAG: twin-arginine translocase subunit TatC [Bacteroidota bacterium]